MAEFIENALEDMVNGTTDVFEEDDPDFKGFNDKKWLLESDPFGKVKVSSCKRILYETIDDHARVWDVLILIPNAVFLAFLLFKLRKANQRLAATNAPVLAAFHTLVLASSIVGVVRCVMAIFSCYVRGHAAFNGQTTDKILWMVLRATLLATEISVLAFALLSGHLDSKAGIRRVVFIASSVSSIFTIVQMTLEFAAPDPAFYVTKLHQTLFGHGGRVFWGISSSVFSLVYASVLLLPLTPCRQHVMLPHRKSFYYYVSFLMVLNIVQAIGCGMTESNSDAVSNPGLCFVNMTTYIYFVAFTPIVYFTFLSQFFGSRFAQPTLLFNYKAQMDDAEEDDSRPHHFTLQTTPSNSNEEDLFSQEQNNPIIINGTLDLANSSIEQHTTTNRQETY